MCCCDNDSSNDCTQDCAGNWGGDAVWDNCGSCDNDSSNDCTQDCAGVWGGDATLVEFCEDTDGDGFGNPGTQTMECVEAQLRSEPSNGCELPTNNLFLSSNGEVFYSSDTDIAGFQIYLDGLEEGLVEITRGSGGDALSLIHI